MRYVGDPYEFVRAVRDSNVERLRDWLGYEDTRIAKQLEDMDRHNYHHDRMRLSPEVIKFFAKEAGDEDWTRWGFDGRAGRDAFLEKYFRAAISDKRYDSFDLFLEADIDFNKGDSWSHIIPAVLHSPIDDGRKAMLVEKLLESGIDQVKGSDRFAETALQSGAMRAYTLLLAATGAQPKNLQWALREAASRDKKDVVRYLVERHGADIDAAIEGARKEGFRGNRALLEQVKEEMFAIRDLQARVKMLEEELDALRNPKLNKPTTYLPPKP
ncbi:MAG TPA: hypothetical protein VEF76_14600 [Patescibacteria group bacterium]|nr:hypothetical protein [Patescibacteria group bacterium]